MLLRLKYFRETGPTEQGVFRVLELLIYAYVIEQVTWSFGNENNATNLASTRLVLSRNDKLDRLKLYRWLPYYNLGVCVNYQPNTCHCLLAATV